MVRAPQIDKSHAGAVWQQGAASAHAALDIETLFLGFTTRYEVGVSKKCGMR